MTAPVSTCTIAVLRSFSTISFHTVLLREESGDINAKSCGGGLAAACAARRSQRLVAASVLMQHCHLTLLPQHPSPHTAAPLMNWPCCQCIDTV